VSDLILGVDPGGTTGVVVLDPHAIEVVEFDELSLAKADDGWADWLRRTVPTVDTVAAERYVITARTATLTRQGGALDVLGALRYLTIVERRRLMLQMAADAKVSFPDEVLRKLGQYKQVRGGHARDALRHALLATRRLHGSV
jgi:hypothetical protein